MPNTNTKRSAKNTPGRDSYRGTARRLKITDSDSSSSSGEEDFADHDRRGITDTSRAGIRPTHRPTVRNPYDTGPATPPTAPTPPPKDMDAAIASLQAMASYSPSSHEEVGDDDDAFDIIDDDDSYAGDGTGGVEPDEFVDSLAPPRASDAAASISHTPAASAARNSSEVTPSPPPAAVGTAAAGTANAASCNFIVTLGGLCCLACEETVLGRGTWFTKEDLLRRHLKSNSCNGEVKNVPKMLKDFTTQLFSRHSRADEAMVMEEFPSATTDKKDGYYCRRCAVTGRKDSVERHCKNGQDANTECCAIHVMSAEIWTNHYGFAIPKPILDAIVAGKSPIFSLKNKNFPDRDSAAALSVSPVCTNGKNFIYVCKSIM